jgi:hypothetical protein
MKIMFNSLKFQIENMNIKYKKLCASKNIMYIEREGFQVDGYSDMRNEFLLRKI